MLSTRPGPAAHGPHIEGEQRKGAGKVGGGGFWPLWSAHPRSRTRARLAQQSAADASIHTPKRRLFEPTHGFPGQAGNRPL